MMTPKSLLRHPKCVSALGDLAEEVSESNSRSVEYASGECAKSSLV